VSGGTGRPVVVFSRRWKEQSLEQSYVIRSIAGAASRSAAVSVVTPGAPGPPLGDGGFDVLHIGQDGSGDWPSAGSASLPMEMPKGAVVIVDELSEALGDLLKTLGMQQHVFGVGPATTVTSSTPASVLSVVQGGGESDAHFVGMHVPVNPLAAVHRHNGFGYVDYILILSDRTGSHSEPPGAAAWLTSGFPAANVVVVENAEASLWRGRALRGSTSVDSRTDLWRLIAHARVCVDTAPGAIVARECVESLRFGTPILVPEGATAATCHIAGGGGLTYRNAAELLEGVGQLADQPFRSRLSQAGREYADANYGDPHAFSERVRSAIDQ
jgi:hypothetical protein